MTTGERTGDLVIVSQGLKPGDRVVVEGQLRVQPGMTVRSRAFQNTNRSEVELMARFFIDRPVFAMVIAIIIVLLGAVAIPNLPIASYPEVVPPQVR